MISGATILPILLHDAIFRLHKEAGIMAHLYEVQTDRGTHHVEMDRHHDHMTVADFERILTQVVLQTIGQVVIRNYRYKGPR